MMIKTTLIRLDEAIQEGQTLFVGTKVILPIGDEAELYGFIATEDNPLSSAIDMPPLGECLVFSNRVIFYIDKQLHRFPLFKSVSKTNDQRYRLHLLYVPRFLSSSSEWVRKYYIESMRSEKSHPKVNILEGIGIEENVAYYYAKDCDLYFESKSKLRAIGTGFAVITRRLSKISDNMKYEIFDSHSIMIERK